MKVLSRVAGLLASVFAVLGESEEHTSVAIKVVDAVKKLVDNPALDVLTGLTKNDWDEKLLRKIRNGVDDAVQGLHIPEVTKSSKSAFYNQVADLAAFIRDQPAPHRSAIYAKSASLIASKLGGGKLDEATADTLVQLAYIQQKGQPTA